MNKNEDVDKFLHKYESRAGLSQQQYYRKPPRMHMGRVVDYDPYEMTASFQIEREPYVEMLIPQHKFRDLVERDRYLTELQRKNDYNQSVVEQLRADERVRWDNPAVDKAYKKYLMLLELCR